MQNGISLNNNKQQTKLPGKGLVISLIVKSFFPPLAAGSPPINFLEECIAHSLQPNDSRWWCTSTQLKCSCIDYKGVGSPVTFLLLSQKSEEAINEV